MAKTNKMLIDASHPEETRVVVVRDGRVEEFDFESASRKPLRGNIYLAKITRVEPSLQAAFVEYGGNRHGFLAFNEIHPDYYQIPMADRMALLEEEAAQEAAEEAEADAHAERLAKRRGGGRGRPERGGRRDNGRRGARPGDERGSLAEDAAEPEGAAADFVAEHATEEDMAEEHVFVRAEAAEQFDVADAARDGHHDGPSGATEPGTVPASGDTSLRHAVLPVAIEDAGDVIREAPPASAYDDDSRAPAAAIEARDGSLEIETGDLRSGVDAHDDAAEEDDDDDDEDEDDSGEENGDADGPIQVKLAPVEIDVIEPEGSEDVVEEVPQRPRRRMRSYKIQEVIKRRQVVLIQVVKEERGNKGAALTTYLSLAGRYTVLMPNTARGGGISRKITNPADRKRLKAAAQELDVPEGMGLIVRTAGAARTGQEIKRDFEYLLRLWESVRELTLQSTAPTLVYEEGNLVKRSIRDLYNKDIDDIIVAGDAGYREASDFMRMLSPSQAKSVVHYQGAEPLLARYRVEQQLAALFSPQVTLKSGGYIVINQTEALVAIDVNSGKSTREYSIEETALNTNLEAADEVARQVKLRDLAGLIVIDFIDMEEKRNNRAVERRLKDALRNDRARIQLGRISHFGLMEMSRQRLRTGVVEGSTSQCPHCQGSGIVRSIESIALAVLRGIEDALMSGTRMALVAHTTPQVALYILNSKRAYIIDMEARHGLPITVQGSDKLQGANFTIEKVAAAAEPAQRRLANPVNMEWGFDDNGDEPIESAVVDEHTSAGPDDEDRDEAPSDPRAAGAPQGDGRRKRRRRGRRGRRDEYDDRPERDQAVRSVPRTNDLMADDYGTPPVGGYDGEDTGSGGSNIEMVDAGDDAGDDADAPFDRPSGGNDEAGGRESGDGRRRGRRRGRRGGRRGSGDRAAEHGANAQLDANNGVIAYLEDGSLAPSGDADPQGEAMPAARKPGDRDAKVNRPHSENGAAREHDGQRGDGDEQRSRADAVPARDPEQNAMRDAPGEPVQQGEPIAPRREPSGDAPAVAPGERSTNLPIPAAATTPAVAAPEPVKPRRTTTSSEPVLERVVVKPGSEATSGDAGAAAEAEDASRMRRGWWQRKLGLS